MQDTVKLHWEAWQKTSANKIIAKKYSLSFVLCLGFKLSGNGFIKKTKNVAKKAY